MLVVFFFLLLTVSWITILAVKVSEEKAVKLTREIQRLEDENQCLRWVYTLEVWHCVFLEILIFTFPLNSDEVNSIKTKIQGKYLKIETLEKKIEENVSVPTKPFINKITRKMPPVLKVLNNDLFVLYCIVWTSGGQNCRKGKRNQSCGNKGDSKIGIWKCCSYWSFSGSNQSLFGF